MKEVIYTHWQNRAIEDEPNEVWRFITGADEKFSVSNLGRVKSHRTVQSIDEVGMIQLPQPIILKQYFAKGLYLRVPITIYGKTRSILVHRAVCEAFHENADNKKEVHHIKNIRTYNSSCNLEWSTRKENISHIKTKHNECVVVDIIKKDNSQFKKSVVKKEGRTFIYAIKDHKGEVVYIGKSNNPINRFRQHKTWARHATLVDQFSLHWLRDILKQGEPSLMILKETSILGWSEWEKHFISHYKQQGVALFNKTEGGMDFPRIAIESAAIVCSKPVIQYNLKGEFIKEWPSAMKASKHFGLSKPMIQRVIKNKRKSAGGFMWKYKTEHYPLKIEEIKRLAQPPHSKKTNN